MHAMEQDDDVIVLGEYGRPPMQHFPPLPCRRGPAVRDDEDNRIRRADQYSTWKKRTTSVEEIRRFVLEDLENDFNLASLLCLPAAEFIDWLGGRGFLAVEMECPVCSRDCNRQRRRKNPEPWVWKCNCPHPHETSMRHYSMFTHQHLYPQDAFYFTALYGENTPLHKIARKTGMAYKTTAVAKAKYCRRVMSAWLLHNLPVMKLTGEVEIDESLFGRRVKDHRGNPRGGVKVWIVGLIERATNNMLLFPVDDRSAQTLTHIICTYVEEGSTIYTDGWSGYNQLNALGFQHFVVNHTSGFSVWYENHEGKKVHCHTNKIEGAWKHAKDHFRRINGTSTANFESHLCEIVWRSYQRKSHQTALLELMREAHPLSSLPDIDVPTPLFPTWRHLSGHLATQAQEEGTGGDELEDEIGNIYRADSDDEGEKETQEVAVQTSPDPTLPAGRAGEAKPVSKMQPSAVKNTTPRKPTVIQSRVSKSPIRAGTSKEKAGVASAVPVLPSTSTKSSRSPQCKNTGPAGHQAVRAVRGLAAVDAPSTPPVKISFKKKKDVDFPKPFYPVPSEAHVPCPQPLKKTGRKGLDGLSLTKRRSLPPAAPTSSPSSAAGAPSHPAAHSKSPIAPAQFTASIRQLFESTDEDYPSFPQQDHPSSPLVKYQDFSQVEQEETPIAGIPQVDSGEVEARQTTGDSDSGEVEARQTTSDTVGVFNVGFETTGTPSVMLERALSDIEEPVSPLSEDEPSFPPAEQTHASFPPGQQAHATIKVKTESDLQRAVIPPLIHVVSSETSHEQTATLSPQKKKVRLSARERSLLYLKTKGKSPASPSDDSSPTIPGNHEKRSTCTSEKLVPAGELVPTGAVSEEAGGSHPAASSSFSEGSESRAKIPTGHAMAAALTFGNKHSAGQELKRGRRTATFPRKKPACRRSSPQAGRVRGRGRGKKRPPASYLQVAGRCPPGYIPLPGRGVSHTDHQAAGVPRSRSTRGSEAAEMQEALAAVEAYERLRREKVNQAVVTIGSDSNSQEEFQDVKPPLSASKLAELRADRESGKRPKE